MPAKKRGRRRSWGFVRRLPSKRFQASYVGPDVMRHTAPKTFTLKSDAEHWLATERRLIERGEWTPPTQRAAEKNAQGVMLAEYGCNWIEQRTTRGGQPLRPKSKAHYTKLLTYLDPLAQLPLKSLTPQAVRAWHAATLVDKPVMRAHAYGCCMRSAPLPLPTSCSRPTPAGSNGR